MLHSFRSIVFTAKTELKNYFKQVASHFVQFIYFDNEY